MKTWYIFEATVLFVATVALIYNQDISKASVRS